MRNYTHHPLDESNAAPHTSLMRTNPTPADLTDPDWLPTDEEELDILEAVARRVAWEKAMASQGIMILTLGLTPEEEQSRIDSWARTLTPDQSGPLER